MLNSNEIKNVKFSKAVGGYKAEEVERLLAKICEDYEEYESRIKKFQNKVEEMKKELTQLKNNESSLNNVLVSAQQLADNIIADANKKSEEILNNANTEVETIKENGVKEIEKITQENHDKKKALEEDFNSFSSDLEVKKQAMLAACEESVAREQALFDKLKMEVASFKENMLDLYKNGLEALQKLPGEVTPDPDRVAKAAALIVDEELNVKQVVEEKLDEIVQKDKEEVKENKEEPEEETKEEAKEVKEESKEEVKETKKGFFKKSH